MRLLLLIVALWSAGIWANPVQTDGVPVIDLRSQDAASLRALNGPWAFYWERFLAPEEDSATDALVQLPASWNGLVVRGKTLGGNGYATYRVRLLLPDEDNLYALKMPDMGTAYRLYAGRESLYANGVVGAAEREMKPEYKPGVALLHARGTVVLTLHVSNFHHRLGGAWYPIQIGTVSQVHGAREKALLLDLFLVGCVTIMSLYHMGLFAIRVKETAPLFFSVFCLLIALRTLLTGERFFFDLFPGFNWEIGSKLEYLSFYLAVPVFARFLRKTFSEEFHRAALTVIDLVSFVFSAAVLVLPASLYSYSALPFQVLTILCGIYALYVIALSVLHNRMGARVFLVGMIAFLASVINDVLYSNGVVQTGYLVTYGVLAFILSQAFLLSRRFSRAFHTIETMKNELEQKVEDRTAELRRTTEIAERATRAKTEFLANMSHEIRTPMNAILGFTNLALEQNLSREVHGYLEITRMRCKDLLVIINDILDISKIEAGHFRLEYLPTDPSAIVAELIQTFKTQAISRNLKLTSSLEGDLSDQVLADPVRIRQILLNLISNAFKFTEKGGIHIALSQKRTGASTDLEFRVRDTGIGIPPDKQGIIFDFFTQVDGTNQRKFGGTGLGLYICRSLVQLMKGSIDVESVPGAGSEFRVRFPAQIATAADRQTAGTHTSVSLEHKDARILLVEDDPMNTLLVRTILEKEGCSVEDAASGQEALDLLKTGQFDLILMDGQMPDMDGFETTRKIRESEAGTGRHLPIVALTGLSMEEDEHRSIRAGMDAYLTKPVDKGAMLSVIDRLLAKSA